MQLKNLNAAIRKAACTFEHPKCRLLLAVVRLCFGRRLNPQDFLHKRRQFGREIRIVQPSDQCKRFLFAAIVRRQRFAAEMAEK